MAGWCPYCFEQLTAAGTCPACARERVESAPDDLPAGTSIEGRYVIGRALGRGGFGVTYLGWQQMPGRQVAIKEYLPQTVARRRSDGQVVPHKSSAESEFRQGLSAFGDEARRLAEFQGHPHIVSVFDFLHGFGTAYMVMEYCPGQTALDYLNTYGGKLSMDDSIAIMNPVLEALQVVHKRDMYHRDVSPDNILLTERGVKLIDFGAARTALRDHSMSFSAILKMAYAPPEQYARKGNQGPWTDVYACGATLYHLLCGEPPPGAMDRQIKDDLVPPRARGAKISQSAEHAIMSALALDYRARIQSAPDFKRALEPSSAVRVSVEKPGSKDHAGHNEVDPAKEPPEPNRMLWWIVAAAVAVLVIAPLGSFGLWWLTRTPQIVSFQVEPEYAQPGQPVTLRWQTSGSQRVDISPSDGSPLPSVGYIDVVPTTTTTYTLTAAGRRGSVVSDSRTVTVAPTSPPPAPPAASGRGAAAPSDSRSAEQAAAAVMARMASESTALAAFTMVDRTSGSIKDSESAIWSLDLDAGTSYVFIAAGDDDAKDVDLTLRQKGTTQNLVIDQTTTATAEVRFSPESSGSFELSVIMARCSQDPCSVNVVRLARPKGQDD